MMEKVNRTCNDCAFRGVYSRTARKRYCTKLGQYQEPNAAINCEDFLQTTAPDEPKKYIDADKIHDVIAKHYLSCPEETEATLDAVWDELKAIPGEDVAEIVRCKDCKFSVEPCELVKKNGIPGVLKCSNKDGICNNRLVAPNDFCNYAKRLEATP